MSSTTWSKFYWADWSGDPRLRLCSLAAQGLWMRMLCIANEATPRGYVRVAGKPLGAGEIADVVGRPKAEIEPLLAELRDRKVFSVDRKGMYSRRMISDEKRREIGKQTGSLGGNPSLRKDGGNPPTDNGGVKGRVNATRSTQKPDTISRVAPSGANPTSPSERSRAEDARSPGWTGPVEIWEAVVAAKGEAYAGSYLAPSGWRDLPERAIVCRTSFAADRLRNDLRKLLTQHGVVAVLVEAAA